MIGIFKCFLSEKICQHGHIQNLYLGEKFDLSPEFKNNLPGPNRQFPTVAFAVKLGPIVVKLHFPDKSKRNERRTTPPQPPH